MTCTRCHLLPLDEDDIDSPCITLVFVGEGSEALAEHLIEKHGETKESLMDWLLLRSDPAHAGEEAIYPDNTVLQHLEDMHTFQHDNTDNEFDHHHHNEEGH